MDGVTFAIIFIMLMAQFSVITLSAVSIALSSSSIGLIEVLLMWFASLVLAISVAHFPFSVLASKFKKISGFFEKYRMRLEKMLGKYGMLLAMIVFSVIVWLYIAVPVMTLMRLRRSHIYLASITGNLIFFLPLILFTGTLAHFLDPFIVALIACALATLLTAVLTRSLKE